MHCASTRTTFSTSDCARLGAQYLNLTITCQNRERLERQDHIPERQYPPTTNKKNKALTKKDSTNSKPIPLLPQLAPKKR